MLSLFARKAAPRQRLFLDLRQQSSRVLVLDGSFRQLDFLEFSPSPPFESLLSRLPVASSEVTVTPGSVYHIKTVELEAVDLPTIRRQVEVYLPYGLDEAVITWTSLGPNRALVVACPREPLQPIENALRSAGACGVFFEAREFAQRRILVGQPAASAWIEGVDDYVGLTLASKDDVLRMRVHPTHFDLEVALKFWEELRGQSLPQHWLNDLGPELEGSKALAADRLVRALADSDEDTTRCQLRRD